VLELFCWGVGPLKDPKHPNTPTPQQNVKVQQKVKSLFIGRKNPLAEAVVPSEIFSKINPNGASIADIWRLDDESAIMLYKVQKGEGSITVTFRMPLNMYGTMQKVVEQRIIPGIESYADFCSASVAYFLSRFHEVGVIGFSEDQIVFENQMRQRQSEKRKFFLENNDETIDMLVRDRDLHELDNLLGELLAHRDGLQAEPQPYRDRLDQQILRIQNLLDESK